MVWPFVLAEVRKSLTRTTERRKGLFWFMVQRLSPSFRVAMAAEAMSGRQLVTLCA